MHADRLLCLARTLEVVEADVNLDGLTASFYDMQTWTDNPVGIMEEIEDFKDAGYRLIPDGSGMRVPYFNDYWGWAAVQEFFDLRSYEVEQLFSYYYYNPSPNILEVAKRVREFVAASPGA